MNQNESLQVLVAEIWGSNVKSRFLYPFFIHTLRSTFLLLPNGKDYGKSLILLLDITPDPLVLVSQRELS